MPIYRQVKGFTLIELLVAVAVFAVLAVMSYSGLNATMKTREITEINTAELHSLQMALTIMQRDFSQLNSQSARDEFGDTQPALATETNYNALVEFSHSGWRNPAQQLRGTLQRVAYVLEDETVYRWYWPHIHRGPQEEAVQSELLTNVQNLRLEFQDADKNWNTSWPPVNQPNSGLPIAVRLTLELAGDIEISRLFDTAQ